MRAAAVWLAFAIAISLTTPADSFAAETSTEVAKEKAGRLMDEAQELAASGEPESALACMTEAAATGDAEAINGLATFVNMGIGGEPDPGRARELWQRALAAGSIGASLNLGLQLMQSDAPADHTRAVKLLGPLYDSPPEDSGKETTRGLAAGGLGIAYTFGLGVEQDVRRGVALLEECDAAGAAWEQTHFLLGRAYESGWGEREPNPQKSSQHFWAAAEGGHPAAQWHYGMVLLRGEPKDEIGAYSWIRKAAEGGDRRGMLSTAVMLATGAGVAENDAEAREWYQRAVNDFASAHALRGLGGMLLVGEGGAKDAARGWAYMKLAAEAGEETAKLGLERLADRVSARDRRKARKLAEEWVAQHGPPRLDD